MMSELVEQVKDRSNSPDFSEKIVLEGTVTSAIR